MKVFDSWSTAQFGQDVFSFKSPSGGIFSKKSLSFDEKIKDIFAN